MSVSSQIYLFLFLNLLVITVLVLVGMYLVRFFMNLLNPGFWCNARVIAKEPEFRTSTSSRGLSSTFHVYTVTMELRDKTQFRYIVPLDTYVDLELDAVYEFYIETNEIKDYNEIDALSM